MIDRKKANNAFDKYTSNFNMTNKLIYLKYNHTYRTVDQSLNICKSLNLNEEDTNIAYLIALLHDFGRFEQVKKYNTFNGTSLKHRISFFHLLTALHLFEYGNIILIKTRMSISNGKLRD